MNLEFLNDYGIDYQKGLSRCMNDTDFYTSFLSMFLKDDSFQRAKEAYFAKDYQKLFLCSHELKGVCGNANIGKLFDVVSALVDLLRHEAGTQEEIDSLFLQMEETYNLAITGIQKLVEQKNG